MGERYEKGGFWDKPKPSPENPVAEPVTLKPCPCGLTPLNLIVLGEAENARPKYAFIAGDCCNEWIIEYRNQYEPIGSPEAIARAVKEWNAATRGALAGEAGGS